MLVPGQSAPAEGSGSSSRTSSNSYSSSGGRLSHGAIAGIAVACVAFVGILVALFFVLGRNRVYRQWASSQDERIERTARWAFFGSHAPSWQNHHSELDSNPSKRATTEVTFSTSENHPSAFSPQPGSISPYGAHSPQQPQSNWRWDTFHDRIAWGPTELPS